jgi:hypothetical protein
MSAPAVTFSLTVPAYQDGTLWSMSATEHSGVHENTVSGYTVRLPKGNMPGSRVYWTRDGIDVTFTRII